MINIKEEKMKEIESWTDDSIHVVADFDRTITVGNSVSSWSVLSKSDKVPKSYVEDRQKLYEHYRPFEIDYSLDFETKNQLMIDWWIKHIKLLIKYQLSEDVINDAATNLRVMAFREGAREFLESMRDRDIPVIIISAGIGNFIQEFLIKNDCDFENIYIISNFIKFENGIASGIAENIIHSLNKNEVSLSHEIKEKISNRPNIILLGDSVSDIKMVSDEKREAAFKIGFLEENVEENADIFKESFDVVCTDNTSYSDLFERIKILRR